MTQDQKKRVAFEAAMAARGYPLDFLVLDGDRRYAYMETEWAFRGWEAATATERERIANLWAGCTTEAEGHGLVDIGASIRVGRLIDAS